MSIIRIKLDRKKLLEEYVFKGAKGEYYDLTLLENRDGTDRFGNDFMLVQDLGQSARKAGKKGPIVGNAKYVGTGQSAPRKEQPPQTETYTQMNDEPTTRSAPLPPADNLDEDVPFN